MNITDITDNKLLSNLKTEIQLATSGAWEYSNDVINIDQWVEQWILNSFPKHMK